MPVSHIEKGSISYVEIDAGSVDLFDDAWGFSSHYHDIIHLLSLAVPEAPGHLVTTIMEKISKRGNSSL